MLFSFTSTSSSDIIQFIVRLRLFTDTRKKLTMLLGGFLDPTYTWPEKAK